MEERSNTKLAQKNNMQDHNIEGGLQPLEEYLTEQYEIQTYKMMFGMDKDYVPYQTSEYWYCGCGERNFIGEKICHKCNQKLDTLLAGLDKGMLCMEYLYRISIGKQNSNSISEIESNLKNLEIIGNYKDAPEIVKAYKERIQKLQNPSLASGSEEIGEQKKVAVQPVQTPPVQPVPQVYYNNQKSSSKIGSVLQWLLIVCAIAIVCGIIGGSYPLMKYNEYQNAMGYYEAGAYEKAAELFDDLRGYKDSGELYFKAYNEMQKQKEETATETSTEKKTETETK